VRRDPAQLRHELDVLSSLARSLASTTRLDDLLFEIVRAVSEVLEFDDCVLYLWNEDDRLLEQRAAWGPKLDVERRVVKDPMRVELGQGIVGSVAASRLVELVDDVSVDRRYVEDAFPAGSELTVPILHQDRLVGVIDAESRDKRSFGAEDAIILTRFADLVASSIVLLRRREQESRRIEETLREVEGRLRHLSTHDPLTGLLDRVHFHEEVSSSLQAWENDGPPVAIISLALDRFHAVNRAAGPQAGDELLQRVATVCRDRARRSDVAARVAGVGFAVLVRGASLEETVGLAQTIRSEIESLPVPPDVPPLAASAGVAAPAQRGETVEQLLGRAERARHAAEDSGGGVASA